MTEKEMLQLLLDKMTSFENDFGDIKNDIRRLQEGQESLKSDVKSLEDKLLKELKTTNEQVVKNSEDISQLATKKDIDNLDRRFDYQLVRINKVEEEVYYLKAQHV